MIVVCVGWMYVVSMMAIAEAISPSGSVLGAVMTFTLWGVAPVALVLYVMRAPARRRARQAAGNASGPEPDGGGHAARDAVAAERKES